jgi:hypothetical protein
VSPLWIVAPAVVVVGAVPAGVWAARASAEVRALRADVARWSAVPGTIGETRAEADAIRARLDGLRHR